MDYDYIQLNSKRYKIVDSLYEPIYNRQRVYRVGLTGLTLIQDFTNSERMPYYWNLRLRVFISDPWPDANYGTLDDLKSAYILPQFEFIELDQTTTHQVGIPTPIQEVLRVPANWEGHCNGIAYVDVQLLKIQEEA